LYLSAKAFGNESAAQKHLTAAIDALEKGDYDDKTVAAALKGSPTIPAKDLVRMRESVERKVITLAALGLVDAPNREMYFSMARKLNFEPTFPHLLVEKVVGPPTR
jgi:hypothetical protein